VRYLILFSVVIFSCSQDNPNEDLYIPQKYDILALGDSYTIGQGVCENCTYPRQLIDSLKITHELDTFKLRVIAQTGWTTNTLLNNINSEENKKY